MRALLRADELHYAGRTWTANPPLALPIEHDAWGYYVAIPELTLVARARTMAILPVALAVSLSLLWDATARRAKSALTPPADAVDAFQLLLRLRARFSERAGRTPVVPVLAVPACPETCQGGAACGCRPWGVR